MNKKVITFLSLFSLVLILSIYYVISPFGESNTPIDNNVNVNVNLNNEEDAYFVSLEVAKEEDYSIQEDSIIEVQKLDIPLLAPDEDDELLFKTMTALHLPQDV